ncbi:uncharacterized protein [Periplaneta americana]|uniref:uncharacterized protein isoform X2 n=1 Tax=Periplaneta americana TaxID=6978 RepID=UPI0037E8DE37
MFQDFAVLSSVAIESNQLFFLLTSGSDVYHWLTPATIFGNYPGTTRLGSRSCLQESHREFRVNKRIRRHYGDADNTESEEEIVIAYGYPDFKKECLLMKDMLVEIDSRLLNEM